MNIAVFGATGTAGSAVVTEALRRGHHVTACSRRPRDDDRERLTVRAVDAEDAAAVGPILANVDAAVLAVRLAPGEEARIAPMTDRFLDSAARHGTRVVIVGGAAPLRSPNWPDRLVLDDPDFVQDAWRAIARASLDQYRVCERHASTGWTYVSPSALLEPGDATGRYRRGTTTLLTDAHGASRVTSGDLAAALVDELEHPRGERHVTIASA